MRIPGVLAFLSCGLPAVVLLAAPPGAIAQSPSINLTRNASQDRHPAWSPSGSLLAFESDRSGTWDLYLIDPDGTESRPIVQSPGNDRYPAWHPDGDRLAFVSDRTGRPDLYVMDLRAGRTRGRRLAVVAVSPDGARGIRIFDTEGQVRNEVVTGMHRVTEPAWPPDGRRLAFAARGYDTDPYDVYLLSLSHEGAAR